MSWSEVSVCHGIRARRCFVILRLSRQLVPSVNSRSGFQYNGSTGRTRISEVFPARLRGVYFGRVTRSLSFRAAHRARFGKYLEETEVLRKPARAIQSRCGFATR